MQLSINYIDSWHPLNNRLQLANSWPQIISKLLAATMDVATHSQITAASEWPCLFCTLGVFV